MDALEIEVARRPMRTFALGVVGLIATIALVVALAITVLGIPLAIVLLFTGVFAAYAGIAAALTTIGAALVRHRSQNVYVHLGVGCALYMLLAAIPWLGGFVTLAVAMLGVGTIVATRAAGLLDRRGTAGAAAA